MDQKVCRNCWTWYPTGHLVCPKCRVRLSAPGAATPPDPTPLPETPGLDPLALVIVPPSSGWAAQLGAIGNRLTIGAIGVVVVAGAVLLLGARYFSPLSSTDGSFTVKPPTGWTASSLKLSSGEKPLLALNGPIQDGLQAHFVVTQYPGSYIPMNQLEAMWPRMVETQAGGQNGAPGPFSTTSVDGSPAITSDSSLKQGRIEFLVVDHANRTYVVIFTGAASGFAALRSSGFDAIIASWHWK